VHLVKLAWILQVVKVQYGGRFLTNFVAAVKIVRYCLCMDTSKDTITFDHPGFDERIEIAADCLALHLSDLIDDAFDAGNRQECLVLIRALRTVEALEAW
jgi:hypothetical protein